MALVILTIPDSAYVLNDALSFNAVLNYADEHHWLWGKDIVFTYGPLGFLSSRYYFAHATMLRFAVDVTLSLCISWGVIALAWRTRKWYRGLLVFTFVFMAANIDPRYDLLLYIGLFCWAMLCFLDCGKHLARDAGCLTLFVVYGVFVKGNFLMVGGITVLALVYDLAIRRNFVASLLLLVTPCVTILLGWLALGQSWNNLVPFFSGVFTIAAAYNATAGLDGLQVLRTRGIIIVILLLCAAIAKASVIFLRPAVTSPSESQPGPNHTLASAPATHRRLQGQSLALVARRSGFALWMVTLIFFIWKHGFVRGDLYHMGFFFGFAAFCALALVAFPSISSWRNRISQLCAILCWAVVLFTMQRWCFVPLPSSLVQPVRCFEKNASVLLHPAAFVTTMALDRAASFAKLDLPNTRELVGRRTVDVFGHDQIYALYNLLNYRPRPLLQSYMAVNRPLDLLNERLYLSPQAPEYVLLQVTPIDRRFAPLEDSFVLRDLLLNYEPVLRESPVLLLKLDTIVTPRMTLLRQMVTHPGEPIDFKEFGGTNLWMEIDAKATALGAIRSFLYKSAMPRVAIWTGSVKRRYKAPAPMLAAGFIVSPRIMDQSDVIAFYTSSGSGSLRGVDEGSKLHRPEAVSVELDAGTEAFWKKEFRCRIYAFEPGLAPGPLESNRR